MTPKLPATRLRAKDIPLPLRPGQPTVPFEDLAAMLELEILLGRKRDFRTRLDRAIVTAYRLGNGTIPRPTTSRIPRP